MEHTMWTKHRQVRGHKTHSDTETHLTFLVPQLSICSGLSCTPTQVHLQPTKVLVYDLKGHFAVQT